MSGLSPTFGVNFISPLSATAPNAPTANQGPNRPGANPLQIGSVIFNSEEVPADLEIGLEAHVKVTDLIGGGRVVQFMGNHPSSVTWTGRIWAPNVRGRVQALRQLLVAGSEVLVSWKSEQYYCIITKFSPKFGSLDCEYSITIEVTRDANGSLANGVPPAIDTQAKALVSNAVTHVATIAKTDPAGSTSLSSTLATVRNAITLSGPLAQIAGPTLNGVLQTITAAIAAAQVYAASQAVGSVNYVPAQQLLSALSLLSANVLQGQNLQTATYIGGSLAQIAAAKYGDADLAATLAQVNGINGIRLPPGVPTVISLPPFATKI